MWIPASAAHLQAAVTSGELEETSVLDAKRALAPSNRKGNTSIAVDVAAMSTAGGCIIYGVGEDEHQRLSLSSPIELGGAADRIAQIAETSIVEVPHLDFRELPLAVDDPRGYLVVIVPRSARAPHQVVVGDEHRFYGRGARGNRLLTEPEIAALYRARQQRENDLAERLREVVKSVTATPSGPDDGCVYAFVQPAILDQDLWDRAEQRAGGEQALQRHVSEAAAAVETSVPFDPHFGVNDAWRRRGADAYELSSMPEDPPPPELIRYLARLTFNIDGRCVLFSGNAAQRVREPVGHPDGRKYLFERTIAGTLTALLAASRALFEQAGYLGAVDLGVIATNLQGAYSVGRHEHQHGSPFWSEVPTYDGPAYTRLDRLSAVSELVDAEVVTLRLLRRLLRSTTGREDYNPFSG